MTLLNTRDCCLKLLQNGIRSWYKRGERQCVRRYFPCPVLNRGPAASDRFDPVSSWWASHRTDYYRNNGLMVWYTIFIFLSIDQELRLLSLSAIGTIFTLTGSSGMLLVQ